MVVSSISLLLYDHLLTITWKIFLKIIYFYLFEKKTIEDFFGEVVVVVGMSLFIC